MAFAAVTMSVVSLWSRNFSEPGKVPLLLVFAAFVVTWVIVRAITRSIRSGRGHLHNVDAGGVHVHHATPGIVLLTVGAVAAVGTPGHFPWREIAAVVIGIGASLVFDEFAMILHLRDDYWQNEGQQSVEAVGLVTACLGLAAAGFAPFGVDDVAGTELAVRVGGMAIVALTAIAVVVCAMKGKFRLALIAIFVWPVAIVGALRLARPGSRWDLKRYQSHPDKRARARARASAFDERWDPRWRHLADVLGGQPNPPSKVT
ncbi:MAG: hypothetical protein R2761_07170 [Acidimicrobiales bacterium]